MKLDIANHPLISHKIALLRKKETDSATFRLLIDELVTLLAYEATSHVDTTETSIETPVCHTTGLKLAKPAPVVIPILRAGLGMLEGMLRLMPAAEVGFLGMVRDEETLKSSTYAIRLTDNLQGRQCILLDPMLATGGTLLSAINYLVDRGAKDVTAICILAAPEGLSKIEESYMNSKITINIFVGALDEKLNEDGFIVPGLGDAGDRMYGVV